MIRFVPRSAPALASRQPGIAQTELPQGGGYAGLILSEAGLQGYWRSGELAGSNAQDQRRRNDGNYGAAPTLGAAGLLVGDNDTAVTYNGTSQFLSIGNPAAFQVSNGTIEALIEATTPGASYRAIMVKTSAWGLWLKDGVLMTFDTGSATDRSTGVNVADGKPHHVAMTFQSGVTNGTVIYLDGLPVLTTTISVVNQNNSLTVASANLIQMLAGTIDEPAIYSTVLSPAQLAAHYAATGLPRSVVAVDTLGTTDVVTRAALTFGRTASDTLGTTTDLATRAAQTLVRTVADSLVTTDAATRTGLIVRVGLDSLSTTDAATRSTISFLRTSDDIAIPSEGNPLYPSPFVFPASYVLPGTTGTAVRTMLLIRTGTDSLATSDSVIRAAQVFTRTAVADNLSTTDVVTRTFTLLRTGLDNLSTTDAVTRAGQLLVRTSADTLATTDSAVRSSRLFVRAVVDLLGTTDAAVKSTGQFTSTASDSLGTTDVAIRSSQSPIRTATDSIVITDIATRAAFHFVRTAADVLSTTDTVTANNSIARFAIDSLNTNDVVIRAPQGLVRILSDSLGTADNAISRVISSTIYSTSYFTTSEDTSTFVNIGVRELGLRSLPDGGEFKNDPKDNQIVGIR